VARKPVDTSLAAAPNPARDSAPEPAKAVEASTPDGSGSGDDAPRELDR
jgi:hypothetical protein